MRKLIVNADDFGLSAGVNRAIIDAHHYGIVTSTTIMVNMPGFQDAVGKIRPSSSLAVGIHLNLTYGAPILGATRVPSLFGPDGRFLRRPEPLLKAGVISEMRQELLAQVKLFIETGLVATHLDTHHHLHRDKRVLEVLLELANELGVTVRALEPEKLLARGFTPKARFQNYFGEVDGVGKLVELIHNLPEGVTEICCHPGYCDDELRELSTLNDIRERELAALTDKRVVQAICESGVKLVNYGEV